MPDRRRYLVFAALVTLIAGSAGAFVVWSAQGGGDPAPTAVDRARILKIVSVPHMVFLTGDSEKSPLDRVAIAPLSDLTQRAEVGIRCDRIGMAAAGGSVSAIAPRSASNTARRSWTTRSRPAARRAVQESRAVPVRRPTGAMPRRRASSRATRTSYRGSSRRRRPSSRPERERSSYGRSSASPSSATDSGSSLATATSGASPSRRTGRRSSRRWERPTTPISSTAT